MKKPKTYELFISGLPVRKTEKYIKKWIKKVDYDVVYPNASEGIAIVKVNSKKDAAKVMKLNECTYKDNTIYVNRVSELKKVPRKEKEGSKTVSIGNLKSKTTKEQIESFFSGCGRVKNVFMTFDEEGVFKGFGHVQFYNSESAIRAKLLLGRKLNGQKIRIELTL